MERPTKQLMAVDWSARYQVEDTPWEKGRAHPELPRLLAEHREIIELAEEILVPGCGFGHDARLLASSAPGKVIGLDLAKEAIEGACQRSSDEGVEWVQGDLFEWQGRYDLVFEHTCFCAIPPSRRTDYVEAMARLIPAGGHLLGVFFLDPEMARGEGPPFGVQPEELSDFFDRYFEQVWAEQPQETFPGREGDGRELTVLWRRRFS